MQIILDDYVISLIDKLAEKEHRSRSNMIEKILIDYVEKEERK